MARRSAVSLAAASLLGLAACGDQPSLIAPVAANHLLLSKPPGVYLLGFDGAPAISADVLAASGGRIVDSIPSMNVLTVDGVTNVQALWAANPKIIEAGFEVSESPIVEPLPPSDGVQAVDGQASTPWFANNVQWDMKTIHAEDGWARTNGGTGINVCIVDTGVDDQHQEMSGQVVARANFVASPASENRVDDPNGHGTHVASTVAAKGVVISGVAPRATVLSARVLNTAGSGSETAIVNGINWCVQNGAHVINMSLGGTRYRPFSSYTNSFALYGAAINNARAAGTIVIVAAGNSNLKMPNPIQSQVPSEVPGVINVGATGPISKSTDPFPPAWNPLDPAQVWRSVDYKAYFSNYGPGVQVWAPGGSGGAPLSEPYRIVNGVGQGRGAYDQIWGVCSSNSSQSGIGNVGGVPSGSGTCLGNPSRYIAYAGTSQASPHVAGLAALLYEQLGGVRSAANVTRIEGCIRNTTDNIGSPDIYGRGRINVTKALDALNGGSC
ncbi:MAG: S8 family serine peptidase [Gemmatimonadaceae bacterium]|nr:S8 family serine peptidase [Gemmatimonadaceae bacterium]